MGFYRPHTPYVSPKPYFDRYPEKSMPVVQGVKEDQADMPAPALGSYKKEQEKLTDDLRRQCVQAYYASITFMDAQVGHVLDALDRLGLADNTAVRQYLQAAGRLLRIIDGQGVDLFHQFQNITFFFRNKNVSFPYRLKR